MMTARPKTVSLLAVLSLCCALIHGQSIDLSGCGDTKGCLLEPSSCTGSNCDYVVTWAPATGGVKFELQGKTDGWVAVGFSEDKVMGEDSVSECLNSGGTVLVQTSYNEPAKGALDILGTEGLSDTSGTFANGIVQCSFTRSLTSINANIFALDKPYYLLLGSGPVSGTSKSFHPVIPTISANTIDVSSSVASEGAGSSKSILVRVHGILMMTAWTLFVCTAILLARYYKAGWPGTLLCDKMPVWFSMHRILNVSVMLFTIIAFILIFVEAKGYSSNTSTVIAQAHPIIGIIVTALAIINPLMALARPSPTAEKRYIFNWAHWTVGIIASILAVINVYLGMQLPKSAQFLDSWVKFILVSFAILYCAVVLILEVHKCAIKPKQGEGMEMQPSAQEKDAPPPGNLFRLVVFVVYLVLAVLLFLIMFIAMVVG